MRAFLFAALLALPAGCGGKEQDVDCCAIPPQAGCTADLLKAGLNAAEIAMVTGAPDAICASAALAREALTRAAAAWPETCRIALGAVPPAAAAVAKCALQDQPVRAVAAPAGAGADLAAACASGLAARGLTDNELSLVLKAPEGVCPNAGVDERRIREIIARDWDAAGCTQFTREEMLRALDSGACGGDAG